MEDNNPVPEQVSEQPLPDLNNPVKEAADTPASSREAILPEEPCGNDVLKKPGTGKKKWLLWTLAAAAAVLGALWILLFQVNRFSLEITMLGSPEILHEVDTEYQDPGVKVCLRGTLFWTEGIRPEQIILETVSEVRQDTLGKYTVRYRASLHNWQAEAERSVRVVDTQSPVITLVETGNTILPGQRYEEEGFTATDNFDGDITHKVRRTEEYGVITYFVSDSSGNPVSVERLIPYYDPIAPEILLEGGEQISICAGTIYSEPGFTATDNADGDITQLVEIEGEVLWYAPGTYEVRYSVQDTYGNLTEVTRQVEVTARTPVETVLPAGKVIYLTFDDGPGPYTQRLLNILDKYGVKATFFVMNTGYDTMMAKIVQAGHSIGIHTMTHDYQSIYASPEAFFTDLYGMQEIIYRNTGVKTSLMRFPGGGSNEVSRFNKGIMTILTQAVQDAGFRYFDWNVDSLDAGGARKQATVVGNVAAGVTAQRVSVVLQHDTHAFSVEAVEDIIRWGLDNGYTFLPLNESSPCVHHTVVN